MTVRQLQECIEKAVHEDRLKPEDDVIVFNHFNGYYDDTTDAYPEYGNFIIEI